MLVKIDCFKPANIEVNLNHLQKELVDVKSESCNPKSPLATLEYGSPSVLRYNLPQSSSFSATGFLAVTDDNTKFTEAAYANPGRTTPVENPTNTPAPVDPLALIAQIMGGQALIDNYLYSRVYVINPANFNAGDTTLNVQNATIVLQNMQTIRAGINIGNSSGSQQFAGVAKHRSLKTGLTGFHCSLE